MEVWGAGGGSRGARGGDAPWDAPEAEHLGRVRLLHVLVEGVGVELREHVHALHRGVDDVGQWEVDEAIGRGELQRRAALVPRQRVARIRPAGEDDRLQIFDVHRVLRGRADGPRELAVLLALVRRRRPRRLDVRGRRRDGRLAQRPDGDGATGGVLRDSRAGGRDGQPRERSKRGSVAAFGVARARVARRGHGTHLGRRAASRGGGWRAEIVARGSGERRARPRATLPIRPRARETAGVRPVIGDGAAARPGGAARGGELGACGVRGHF